MDFLFLMLLVFFAAASLGLVAGCSALEHKK